MTLTILVALAFLVYPGWLIPFLVGMVSVMRSGHGLAHNLRWWNCVTGPHELLCPDE